MTIVPRAALAGLLAACGCGSSGTSPPEGGAPQSDSQAPPAPDAGPAPDGAPPPLGEPFFETRTPPARGARQEHAVVALDGEVYVIGGFLGTGGLTDSVEAYDPVTDSWREVASLPAPLHHANAAAADGRIFVFGFLQSLRFDATGDAYAYDPAADTWTPVAPMPAGTERGSAAMAVVGERIYVVGGARGGTVADVSAYDIEADSWTELPPLPEPREHTSAASIDGIVYVAGGRRGGIAGFTPDVLAFDPEANQWTERAPIPTPRGGVAGAALAGRFFVFGGEGNPDDSSGVFGAVEAYDPVADAWQQLPPMPVPRHGLGAATVGDRIYLPAGATVQAFGAVDTHSAFGLE